ncbi:MAG: PorT family protein [Tannerella sp.]|nr:PorT family protein [Tannerella sp.]
MKKIFFITAVLCAISLSEIRAQWGVAVGYDASVTMKAEGRSANYKPGFHAGVTYDLKKFSDIWYLQSGLLFTSGGWTKDDYTIDFMGALHADISDFKTDMYFLDVPVNFSCRIPIKQNRLILDAGPYLRYGLFGKITFKSDGDPAEYESFDEYSRFDIGSNLGVGLEFKNKYLVNAAWQISITNIQTRTNIQHVRFRIGLGYLF